MVFYHIQKQVQQYAYDTQVLSKMMKFSQKQMLDHFKGTFLTKIEL